MRVRLVRPHDLRPPELQRWQELIRDNPALQSPFFCPQFTRAVSDVRDDVFVGVIEQQSTIIGFFPFQRARGTAGQPVGGPLNDYHGVISASDAVLDLPDVLRQLELSSWRFHGLVAAGSESKSLQVFCRFATSYVRFPSVGGFDAYYDDISRQHGRTMSDQRKRRSRLEMQWGTLRLVNHGRPQDWFDQLIRWKREQYRAHRVVDVFSRAWTVGLLHRLWQQNESVFSARFSVLLAGEVPVAAHFGLQSKDVVHAWFPAYDPRYARYSPGLQMWIELLRTAAESGVRRFDFGRGDEVFKRKLATDHDWVAEGILSENSIRSQWSRICFRAAQRLQRSRWHQPLKRVVSPLVVAVRSRRYR